MRKKSEILVPWTFRGEVFTQEMVGNYRGFVYLITFIPTGRLYVGKKSFWTKIRPKGKKRRVTVASDWERYWSSSELVKALRKEHGDLAFRREILSLHTLDRDVNYGEVREQWRRNVLEAVDETGERIYLNDNIGGKFFPGLYRDWASRSLIA